jgi:uncharacterized protein (DUF362 family)
MRYPLYITLYYDIPFSDSFSPRFDSLLSLFDYEYLIILGLVSLVQAKKTPTYSDVSDLVRESIDLIGGITDIVGKGDVVALKPNIVTGRVSKPGVLTDQRVVESLVKMCFDSGAKKVKIVEGSGYFTPTDIAFEKSGFNELAKRLGAEMVDVDKDKLVELEVSDSLVVDKIRVSQSFMDADVRINIPVMKTHDQLLVTLGVKNLKGIIPKPWKRNFHRIGVVKAIIDLSRVVPIDLTVLDAINAMEGLGPSFGEIVPLNLVFASKDLWSLDAVACQAMGFNIDELDYLIEARKLGLFDPKKLETIGSSIESVARKFKRPPTDLEFGPGISVVSGDACSACRGTIHSVIYDLEQLKSLGEIRDLYIVVGPNAKVPTGLKNTPIVMGTCLKGQEEEGCYVVGCPPNNDQMLAAIKKVQGLQ